MRCVIAKTREFQIARQILLRLPRQQKGSKQSVFIFKSLNLRNGLLARPMALLGMLVKPEPSGCEEQDRENSG